MVRLCTILFVSASMMVPGCGKQRPKTQPRPTSSSQPAGEATAGDAELPAGHPPIGQTMPPASPSAGDGLPAGHPPLGSAPAGHPPTAPTATAPPSMPFTAPAEWTPKPARMMTAAVFALAKVEGDAEDADLAVSSLGRQVPMDLNVERWCGQFTLPDGKTCADAAKTRTLDGTTHPTTIVDIAGAYKGSSMGGPVGSPKPNFRMLAAEVQIGGRPWYVKLIGPENTVAHWEASFMTFVRGAK